MAVGVRPEKTLTHSKGIQEHHASSMNVSRARAQEANQTTLLIHVHAIIFARLSGDINKMHPTEQVSDAHGGSGESKKPLSTLALHC